MSTFLDKIIANKNIELQKQKEKIPLKKLQDELYLNKEFPILSFKESIRNSNTGIIAEFKRRSPSKDWIFKDAKIEDVVPDYAKNGAAAISILTDFIFFGGNLEDLRKARSLVKKPLLRKDFMIDDYQIFQAKICGAHAILLIAACLDKQQTIKLAKTAKELNLEVLLEIHSEKELDNINEYVDMVGINNRNLKTFEVNTQASLNLIKKIPDSFVRISESGISSSQTVKELKSAGFDGFLMGENFMKNHDPGNMLKNFINEL